MMILQRPWIVALAVASLSALACNPKAMETDGGDASASSSSSSSAGSSSSSTSAGATGTTTGMGETGTTTGSATSSTSTSGSSGCSFIDCNTTGMMGSQCDPTSQDCPDGEKCTAVSPMEGQPWGVNECVPVAGGKQLGDACDVMGGKYTGLDDCDVGYICLLTDDDGKGGTCVEFCDVNMTCPKSGAMCVVYNDGSLPICLANCDPLLQDCAAGQGCYPSGGDSFVCFKTSVGPGEGGQGFGCSYTNQCQPGLMCVAAASVTGCLDQSGCCSPFCPIKEGNGPCQMGEECVAYFEMGMAPPGYEDLGVCAIPG